MSNVYLPHRYSPYSIYSSPLTTPELKRTYKAQCVRCGSPDESDDPSRRNTVCYRCTKAFVIIQSRMRGFLQRKKMRSDSIQTFVVGALQRVNKTSTLYRDVLRHIFSMV